MSSSGKTNAALTAAVAFFLLSSCAAYLAFARFHTSQIWVQHTRDVQLALNQFSSMETRAARLRAEYVYSGDSSLLQRQAQVVTDIRTALDSIRGLVGDNVNQISHYEMLAQLTEQRIALMNAAIELKRTGKSTLESQAPISQQIVTNGDAIDRTLESMDAAEQALLAQRQERESTSFQVIAGVLATSLFLALVLVLVHHQLLSDQVRERVRAENAQRALSARLLTMQDEERRRLARELHDSVGQHLAALKMAVSILETRLPGDRILQDCLRLLDDSISETRTISHLLHPPLLDEAGLTSATRWFVEGFAKRSGIEVNLEIQPDLERLSDSSELVLFRVLQEGLTNVHRHSGAKRADVSLTKSGNRVVLKVKDFGRGMPAGTVDSLHAEGTAGGVGLAGMNERIREIGGSLEIYSASNGTEIVATVPFQRRQARPPMAAEPSPQVQG